MLSIEQAMEKAEAKLTLLSVLSSVLDNVQTQMQWNAMEIAVNDDGETMIDDNGDYVRRDVTPDDWCYNEKSKKKVAYLQIISHLEKLI